MRLEDVVIGEKYRIKSNENVKPEWRGEIGTVKSKGLLSVPFIFIGEEGVEFENGMAGRTKDIEPFEKELEVGDKIVSGNEIGELVAKFEEDVLGNNCLIKTKDPEGDIFYLKADTDNLKLFDEVKENLSEGDRILVKDMFGEGTEYEILHRDIGIENGEDIVVYTVQSVESGSITNINPRNIDEVIWKS